MHPKISIITVCKNSEDTIKRTLESVRNFKEVIIADGDNEDATEEICKTYSNVTYYKNKFIGFSEQRNFLISKANCEWCFF